MIEETEFQVWNAYGNLTTKESEGKFFWCIPNYDESHWQEIPKPLYLALHKWAPKKDAR